MLKQKITGSVQEVILPDFPDDDTTVTKSRRVSFGPNFVKEFIVDSAVTGQFMAEYEQPFPSSDSSNADSSHSAIGQSTFVVHENVKVHKAEPGEERAKPAKFGSTVCFSADSPTADMEFTEGCLTLAKSILDKKNKEMTVFIQAKSKEGEKTKEEETNYFEGSQFEMSVTKCLRSKENNRQQEKRFVGEKTRVFGRYDDEMSMTMCEKVFVEEESDVSWEESKENRMPLDAIMRHLDKDSSDSDLFNPEKSFGKLMGANPFELSVESENLNLNESMDISGEPAHANISEKSTNEVNNFQPSFDRSDTMACGKLDTSEVAENSPSFIQEIVKDSTIEEAMDISVNVPSEAAVEDFGEDVQPEKAAEDINDINVDTHSEEAVENVAVDVHSEKTEMDISVDIQSEKPTEDVAADTQSENAVEDVAVDTLSVSLQSEKVTMEMSMDIQPEEKAAENIVEIQSEKAVEDFVVDVHLGEAAVDISVDTQPEKAGKDITTDIQSEKAVEPCEKSTLLADLKVVESLKEQSKEPGCVWSLKEWQQPGTQVKGILSFSCLLLESTASMEFVLKMSEEEEDSLDFCSVVTDSRIRLDEEKQWKLPEYSLVVGFGFDELKKHFEERRQSVSTIRHVPYFLDEVNSILSKTNGYLQQIYSVLTSYPGSRLKGSTLSFRLFSFPIFFSCTVSIDLGNMFRLSRTSLSFEHDFGCLDERKVGEIFEECLKRENSLCEFVVQSTRYLVEMEKRTGQVSKRGHIRLLPEELKT